MSYPRSLQYAAQRLNAYSRQSLLLMPRSNGTAKSGNMISVTLPENAKVDLRTLAMHFKGTTKGAGPADAYASFPKHIETLIDRISVDINGQTVDPGCSQTSQLIKLLFDYTLDASINPLRQVCSNGADQSMADANENGVDYVIMNWPGFLHASPSIVDTALTGPVTINIYLAPDSVLITNDKATGASYTLDDIKFVIDAISLDDGVYDQIVMKRLESGPIPITFPHFVSFQGGLTTSTSTGMTFGVSSQSVDLLIGTFLGANHNSITAGGTGHYDQYTRTSKYFTRPATNLTGSAFNISGVSYPSFRATPMMAYAQTLKSLGMAINSVGGCDQNLDSVDKYMNQYFAHVVRLNHPTDEEGWTSGLDTRGAAVSMSYNTTGGVAPGGGIYPLCYVACTGTLLVGAYRQLQVSL